eukprot:jgi/Psemu1/67488/estExt_Genemark1.C_3270027
MPRKDSSWIEASGLYGTWTFTTQTMTDIGYYKGLAYVVVHLMPDPMQVKSCTCAINGVGAGGVGAGGAGAGAGAVAATKTGTGTGTSCLEADNRACSHGGASGDEGEECVDTETTEVEWSDVTAFFQFGFQLREGIVRKTYHNLNTSDWIGPYNLIMAPIEHKKNGGGDGDGDAELNAQYSYASHNNAELELHAHAAHAAHTHTTKKLFVSRYVRTPWTATELQRPFTTASIFNFDGDVLENIAGTEAINATIHEQIRWRGGTKSRGGQSRGRDRGRDHQGRSRSRGRDRIDNTGSGGGSGENDGENNAARPSFSAPVQRGRREHERGLSATAALETGGLRGDPGSNDAAAGAANDSDDPYAKHAKSCAHGDLRPVLPRITMEQTTTTTKAAVLHSDGNDNDNDNDPPETTTTTTYSMKIDYSMLSVPVQGIDDLYKKWPAMKSHLGEKFPVTGPYCYGKDPHRAYTIRLAYDSSESNATSTWKGIKGCRRPWPCWEGDVPGSAPALPPSAKIPTDNHAPGAYVLDPMGIEFAVLYGMGFLLVVSLVFNCQLANRLTRLKLTSGSVMGHTEGADGGNSGSRSRSSHHHHHQQQQQQYFPSPSRAATRGRGTGRRAPNPTNHNELEEPLLNPSTENDNQDNNDDDELLSSSFDHPQSLPESQSQQQ